LTKGQDGATLQITRSTAIAPEDRNAKDGVPILKPDNDVSSLLDRFWSSPAWDVFFCPRDWTHR